MLSLVVTKRRPPCVSRRPHGFTLIELMVAVAIVGVSMGLAAPSFAQMVSNYRLRSGAEGVLNGLNLARAEAVRRNAQVSFALTGTKTGWTISDSGGTVIQSRADPETGGLNAASSNAATSVIFLPTGLVDSSSDWLTSVLVSSATTGTGSRRINVLGGGLIRMCDPAVAMVNDPRRC